MSSGDSPKYDLFKLFVSPTFLSFLGGFASASIAACAISSSSKIVTYLDRANKGTENNADNIVENESNNSSSGYNQTPSIMRRMSIDYIASRIGEIPGLRRRSHWPWDQMKRSLRRSNSNSTAQTNSEPISDDTHDPIPSEDSLVFPATSNVDFESIQHDNTSNNLFKNLNKYLDEDKSGLCIGNIFGMDVGGTLAKLVYFEQKAENPSDLQGVHHRELIYQRQASARAVIMSRRGLVTSAGEVITGNHSALLESKLRSSYTTNDHLTSPPLSVVRSLEHSRRFSLSSIPQLSSDRKSPSMNCLSAGWTSPKRIRRKHSISSDDDVEALQLCRQISLPDDVEEYFKSVDSLPPSFDPRHENNDEECGDHHSNAMDFDNGDKFKLSAQRTIKSNPIRRSRSMIELAENRDHAEALDRFYTFARRLDSYREGVKDEKLSFYSHKLGGEFHFLRFETRRMQHAMDLIRANKLHVNIREMGGTGGGAHRFADQWDKELGIKMKKQDELDSLVVGMQFVLSNVVGECYTFRPKLATAMNGTSAYSTTPSPSALTDGQPVPCSIHFKTKDLVDEDENASDEDHLRQGRGDIWWWSRKVQRDAVSDSSTYPYLVVTIGTGVSIIRVDGPRKYVRVSGSTIGGGTYLGLIRLLTDVDDYDDIMRLAEKGDPTKCDMMVGDIYGDNPEALKRLGLPSHLVASSFGKLVTKEDPAAGLKQEDLARALLLMITINIGQVAYLNAQLMNTSQIYFVGNFLRENKSSQRRLSYAIHYWSKGKMEALFLEHEGYFGALGAFLLTQEEISASNKKHHARSNLRHQ